MLALTILSTVLLFVMAVYALFDVGLFDFLPIVGVLLVHVTIAVTLWLLYCK